MYLVLLAILIVLGWIAHPIIYQKFANSNSLSLNPEHIKVIAHRGANAPENTLASVQAALELGVDIIEIDVHLTKDNELIVIHDEALERTTNGNGNVSEYTLEELKKFDAGSWFSNEFVGEKLPTLREILNLINGRATCLIELKWGNNNPYKGMEQKVIEDINTFNAVEWTIVQSFESSYLEKIHQFNTEIRLGKLLVGSWGFPFPFYFDYKLHWGAYTPPIYIEWVNFYYKRATPSFVKHLKSYGVQVGVYTVNSKPTMIKQINMGIDALITNDAEMALTLIQNK